MWACQSCTPPARFPDLLGTCHVYDSNVVHCRGNFEFVAGNQSLPDIVRSWRCSRGITPMCTDDMYENDIHELVRSCREGIEPAQAIGSRAPCQNDRGRGSRPHRGSLDGSENPAWYEGPYSSNHRHRLHASCRSPNLRRGMENGMDQLTAARPRSDSQDASTILIFAQDRPHAAPPRRRPTRITRGQHACSACEDEHVKLQTTKTLLPRDFIFDRDVGLGILQVKDANGTRLNCLNVVDMVTT